MFIKPFNVQTDLCSVYCLCRICLAVQRDEALLPLLQPDSGVFPQGFMEHQLSLQSTTLLSLIQNLFSILQDPHPLLLGISRCLLKLSFLVFFEVLTAQSLALSLQLLELRVSLGLGARNGLQIKIMEVISTALLFGWGTNLHAQVSMAYD